jgi:hypothetical protein
MFERFDRFGMDTSPTAPAQSVNRQVAPAHSGRQSHMSANTATAAAASTPASSSQGPVRRVTSANGTTSVDVNLSSLRDKIEGLEQDVARKLEEDYGVSVTQLPNFVFRISSVVEDIVDNAQRVLAEIIQEPNKFKQYFIKTKTVDVTAAVSLCIQ